MSERPEHNPPPPTAESEADRDALKAEYLALNAEWSELESYSARIKHLVPARLPKELIENFDRFMLDLGQIRARQIQVLSRQAEIERLVFRRP